ncbi:LINE-1 retrotransposable element ORF1 protein [Plecturocebus cupreus]
MNNGAHSSALELYKEQTIPSRSSLTTIYPESPHKGELRLTSGRYPSGTKQKKKLAATLTVLQLLQTGRNQHKKDENTRNQNASLPTKGHNSSPAKEQGWMENGWVIRNISKLKEHVLTQCKEIKNREKRFDEMLMRINNLEGNISEFMELKNTTQELCKAYTSYNSQIDQAEERVSEVEDQLNEIKQEGKIREKRVKRNEQSLQEIWNYVKRPNLRLISVPECDGENESKLENTLQDIIQENFPNLARQDNIHVQEIQRTPQRYSSRRATPRHIIIRFTRVEMKEKMLKALKREMSDYPQREAHQTHSRSISRNPTNQKRVGANIQHP